MGTEFNRVNISRVYPGYLAVKSLEKTTGRKHTIELAKTLLQAFDERFLPIIDEPLFVISILLDSNFGLKAFPLHKQETARRVLIRHLKSTIVEDGANAGSGEVETIRSDETLSALDKRRRSQ